MVCFYLSVGIEKRVICLDELSRRFHLLTQLRRLWLLLLFTSAMEIRFDIAKGGKPQAGTLSQKLKLRNYFVRKGDLLKTKKY